MLYMHFLSHLPDPAKSFLNYGTVLVHVMHTRSRRPARGAEGGRTTDVLNEFASRHEVLGARACVQNRNEDALIES